jgi:mevalonate kinase
MTETATASAPGKVILAGEHFVVNGAYSVAAAVDKRVGVTISEISGESYIASGDRKSKLEAIDGRFSVPKAILDNLREQSKSRVKIGVSISSQIPSGSGLGSSAAVSVATSAAGLKFFGLDTDYKSVFDAAILGEKKVHGNPSGIDVEASIRGGMVLFSRTAGTRPIQLSHALQLLVVYSGKPRRTGILISKVAEKKRRFPHFFDRLTNAVSFVSLAVVDAITAGDLPRLGAFMNISQTALNWIGVSTPLLDRMLEELATRGVLGVKLTGAGGGGSVIALPRPDDVSEIAKFAQREYPWSFVAQIPQEGLKVE